MRKLLSLGLVGIFLATSSFSGEAEAKKELQKRLESYRKKGYETKIIDIRKYGYRSLQDVRGPDICCKVIGNAWATLGCIFHVCGCVRVGCGFFGGGDVK